jgi:hypothetical protein
MGSSSVVPIKKPDGHGIHPACQSSDGYKSTSRRACIPNGSRREYNPEVSMMVVTLKALNDVSHGGDLTLLLYHTKLSRLYHDLARIATIRQHFKVNFYRTAKRAHQKPHFVFMDW